MPDISRSLELEVMWEYAQKLKNALKEVGVEILSVDSSGERGSTFLTVRATSHQMDDVHRSFTEFGREKHRGQYYDVVGPGPEPEARWF